MLNYRQDCAKRKLPVPVLNLHAMQKSGFSPIGSEKFHLNGLGHVT